MRPSRGEGGGVEVKNLLTRESKEERTKTIKLKRRQGKKS